MRKPIALANANLLYRSRSSFLDANRFPVRSQSMFRAQIVFQTSVDFSDANRVLSSPQPFCRRQAIFRNSSSFSQMRIAFSEGSSTKFDDKLGCFFLVTMLHFITIKCLMPFNTTQAVLFFCETDQAFRFCFKTDRRYQKQYSCVHEIPG